MSTRSSITALMSDGSYKSIYCHFDGYIEGVGHVLLTHYQDQKEIEQLMHLGDLRIVGGSLEACGAYGRDRGEIDTEALSGETAEEVMGRNAQDFNYLWDGSKWLVDGDELAGFFAAPGAPAAHADHETAITDDMVNAALDAYFNGDCERPHYDKHIDNMRRALTAAMGVGK